jgi:UDP-N-acetyl-2-amino-2-deoxyglucuronate dehydrogenase
LEKASVKWRLSIDENQLPAEIRASGKRSFREIRVNDERLPLDNGINDLHTQCYHQIFRGEGPGIDDATPSILLCHQLRKQLG